jgi:hypothetical protein
MMSELPPVSASFVDSIFDELESMVVELDDDPLEYGPRRLLHKTAETQNHLSRCETLFIQISQLMLTYKRAKSAYQLDFDLQLNQMLAHDPEVRSGRNVADRTAIATVKMKDIKIRISDCDTAIQDLEVLLITIKSKRMDLKNAQGRLRDQTRLCQEEIGLGGRWQSKRDGLDPTPRISNAPLISRNEIAAMDEEFYGGHGVESNPKVDIGELDSFLESIPDEIGVAQDTHDVDISSILDDVPSMPEESHVIKPSAIDIDSLLG